MNVESFESKFKGEVKNLYSIERFFLSLLKKEENSSIKYDLFFSIYNKVKINKKLLLMEKVCSFSSLEDIDDYIEKALFEKKCEKFLKNIFSNKYKHLYSIELLQLVKNYAIHNDLSEIKSAITASLARFLYKCPNEYYFFVKDLLDKNNKFKKENILSLIDDLRGATLLKEEDEKLFVCILDYEASEYLGSKNWCISYSEDLYKSYKETGDFFCKKNNLFLKENHFVFVFDFGKNRTDPNKLIGYTIDSNSFKIYACMNENDLVYNYSDLEAQNIKSLVKNIKVKKYKFKGDDEHYLKYLDFYKSLDVEVFCKKFNEYTINNEVSLFEGFEVASFLKQYAYRVKGLKIKVNSTKDFFYLFPNTLKSEYFFVLDFKNKNVFESCLLKNFGFKDEINSPLYFMGFLINKKVIEKQKIKREQNIKYAFSILFEDNIKGKSLTKIMKDSEFVGEQYEDFIEKSIYYCPENLFKLEKVYLKSKKFQEHLKKKNFENKFLGISENNKVNFKKDSPVNCIEINLKNGFLVEDIIFIYDSFLSMKNQNAYIKKLLSTFKHLEEIDEESMFLLDKLYRATAVSLRKIFENNKEKTFERFFKNLNIEEELGLIKKQDFYNNNDNKLQISGLVQFIDVDDFYVRHYKKEIIKIIKMIFFDFFDFINQKDIIIKI